nr:hypothetical protein [Tanacetum cinerariifolium]
MCKNVKAVEDVIENESHLIAEIVYDDIGSKLKGGFEGYVGSCGDKGGSGGSIARIGGGLLTMLSMESKDGLGGGGLVVVGWVRAGGGEVNGGGVVVGISRSLLGEDPIEIMGERGVETFCVDGGAET